MTISSIPSAPINDELTYAEITRSEMELSTMELIKALDIIIDAVDRSRPHASELIAEIQVVSTLIARTRQTKHACGPGPITEKTAKLHEGISIIINPLLIGHVRDGEIAEARKATAELRQLGRTLNLLLQVAAN